MPKKIHFLSPDTLRFPHPEKALEEPDGLLAIGGDLSSERLIEAYNNAIFPWFSEGEPILWWSPAERAIIEPKAVYISKSMARFIRKTSMKITINHAFTEVVTACSQPRETQSETWISPAIRQAYIQLHHLGHAHSIEVWNTSNQLVGGLYGVNVGNLFCGESMFHKESNASKLAFIALCQHFQSFNGILIDCQMMTPHLESLGVTAISRQPFIDRLQKLKQGELNADCWQKQRIPLPLCK